MLALALILDAVFGEPDRVWQRVPHPAVLMGRLVGALDAALNRGAGRRAKGVMAVAVLVVIAFAIARVLSLDIFFGVFEVLGAAILLAQRSLMDHVRAVATALGGSVEAGRKAVAMIVGRETATMDETDVARAAIESAAENFSDGIVAPAFWFLLLGLPGMAIYKIVNTADSMIGYRNARYEEFGWAAARLDDLLNWIPARISAFLIVFAGILRRRGRDGLGPVEAFSRRFDGVMEEAPAHRSPNAGWPEAAAAHSLDVVLSGPRVYDGILTDDPFVNDEGAHAIGGADILRTMRLLWSAWGALLALVAIPTLLML